MRLLNVNPFKVGDKVVYKLFQDNTVFTATHIRGLNVWCDGLYGCDCHMFFERVN